MTKQEFTTLVNGGNVTRWSTLALARKAATEQAHYTAVLLGCDGRFWVPATPAIARKLMAAGYEPA